MLSTLPSESKEFAGVSQAQALLVTFEVVQCAGIPIWNSGAGPLIFLMPMSKKIEERIRQLRQLRTVAASEESDSILLKALQDKSGVLVAEAAKTVGESHRPQWIPDLLSAYARMFDTPVRTDPKCFAKTAILKALTALDYEESAPFIKGSTHIQMEPVFGGQEDSAPPLRACAILALVQCTDLTRPEILRRLVDALADKSDTVRVEAVRALEQMNGDEASLVLRLKAHDGDSRSAVLGQVFDSIIQLEQDRGVQFVAQFLNSPNPETRDEAALALGACRRPEAIRFLMAAWQASRDSLVLRALSSSREESALKFLLDLVRDGVTRDSAAAREALSLHSDSPEIQARLEQAEKDRPDGFCR